MYTSISERREKNEMKKWKSVFVHIAEFVSVESYTMEPNFSFVKINI